MITSYRQPPQQAIAALAVAVLTKAKDVMGHRDTATRNILRAGSGIRGNRSREEGVGKVCRKQPLVLHPAFGSDRMFQSLSNVQPGGLAYLQVGYFLVKSVAQSRRT